MMVELAGSVPGAVRNSTLCDPVIHVHVTVPPLASTTLSGEKVSVLLGPTATAAVTGAVPDVDVNTTGDPLNPLALAVSVCVPIVSPSVRVTDAMPFAAVTGDPDDTDPPPTPTTHVTVTPALGFPLASLTITLCAV